MCGSNQMDKQPSPLPVDPKTLLEKRLCDAIDLVVSEGLPGCEEHVAANPEIRGWLDTQEKRIEKCMADANEIKFESALGNWRRGWERVNALLAEKYRLEQPDPNRWELRYFKWMEKVQYIRYEGPKYGEFLLYPRTPDRCPKERWYTVDEMLFFLSSPTVLAVADVFGVMPAKPEYPRLKKGEQIVRVDLTKRPPTTRFQRGL
jgi:hypothetical protein